MLLCDVALGNMYEATKAEYVEKLPTGFHSTKGLGKTAPDPASVKEIDGSVVSSCYEQNRSIFLCFHDIC